MSVPTTTLWPVTALNDLEWRSDANVTGTPLTLTELAGKLSSDEYKNVHLHRIDASGVFDDHEGSSKGNAEWDFFVALRDAGRRTAQSWLAEHYGAIGVRGTLDLQNARL